MRRREYEGTDYAAPAEAHRGRKRRTSVAVQEAEKNIKEAVSFPDFSKENNDSLVAELGNNEMSREKVLGPLVDGKAFLAEIEPVVKQFSANCDKLGELIVRQNNFT